MIDPETERADAGAHRPCALAARARALLLAGALAAATAAGAQSPEPCCGTKTPYPAPAAVSVSPLPAGARVVHTQLVARHGARGLTRPGADLAWIALLRRAEQDGALRARGRALRAELERFVEVQAELGRDLPSLIDRPGYGALTRLGVAEQRGIAERMAARVAPLLDAPPQQGLRRVEVLLSGVDRAEQSAWAFLAALEARAPAMAPLLAQARRDARADRFTLYFHKLGGAADGAAAAGDAVRSELLRRSRAYQAYLDSPALQQRLQRFAERPEAEAQARAVLEGLFEPPFVERLMKRGIDLGRSVEVERGAGRAPLRAEPKLLAQPPSAVDMVRALFDLAIAAPLFVQDAALDLRAYVGEPAMRLWAEIDDHESFYEKGPATVEGGAQTYAMAAGLLADMLVQAEMAAAGGVAAARLRFAHAEIVLPLALLLDLPGARQPLAAAQDFRFATQRWRAADWIPMSANLQWDTVLAADGRALVRMLFNERETAFGAACDGARLAPGSAFYLLDALRACLGPLLPP
jgi:hypothetical protein